MIHGRRDTKTSPAHAGAAAASGGAFRDYGSVGRWLVAPALIYAIIVTQLPFI